MMNRTKLAVAILAAVFATGISPISSYAAGWIDTNVSQTSNTAQEDSADIADAIEAQLVEGADAPKTEEELAEEERAAAEAAAVEAAALARANIRTQAAELAESWAGRGVYRFGGNNPASGVDCSGFVRFVLQNTAGVHISRTSASQAGEGVAVASIDQARPGDLIFYAKGGRVNHVAMYIGNGRVVSASNESLGIRVTPWNYRPAVAIRNVLGA